MHASLGNDLSVEMRELLDKPDILEKGRAACSCSLNVQVIDNRCAIGMGELVVHVVPLKRFRQMRVDASAVQVASS